MTMEKPLFRAVREKLFKAVFQNDLNEVKLLLENGTVPVTVTARSIGIWTWTLAQRAVTEGHLEILKFLVKKEPSLLKKNTQEEYGAHQQGLLELACERGYFEIVKFLVEECKADIFEERLRFNKDYKLINPIFMAARSGELEILKYLIKKGNVDINAPFRPRKDAPKDMNYPKSLLFIADENSRSNQVLEYLLKETNIDLDVDGGSIIFYVNNDLVKYLLEKYKDKFDVNKKDGAGRTLLHYSRDPKFIEYLVEKAGANISIPDKEFKWTPLHFGVAHNSLGACKCLINLGANVESKDKDGDTPLHLGAIGGYVDICKVLVKHGANINSKNNKGDSPLHYAINGYYDKFAGQTELSYAYERVKGRSAPQVFRYLIDHGANITQENNEGKTAVDYLIAKGNLKGLKYVIRRGIIDVNQQNERRESLVQLAVIYNQMPILDYLVRIKHANINTHRSAWDYMSYYDRQSPLMTALSLRHNETSKFLIKHSAKIPSDDLNECSAEARELYERIMHDFHLGRARRSIASQSFPTHFQNESLNNSKNGQGRSVFEVANRSTLGVADPLFVHEMTFNASRFYGFLSFIHFLVMYIRGSVYQPEEMFLQKGPEDTTIEDAINALPDFKDIH